MRRAILGVVMLAVACTARGGIPPAEPFSALTFEEAYEQAKERDRFLVIAIGMAPESTWGNHTLAAWILWHAVAIHVPDTSSLPSWVRRDVATQHAVVILSRGKVWRTLPRRMDAKRGPFAAGMSSSYPGAVQVLFECDFALERAAALEPIFAMRHEKKNPPPPAPEREFFAGVWDGLGEVIEAQEGEDVALVLERWSEAQAAVLGGERRLATGLYTWLWERMDVIDPAFRAARTTLLAEAMRDLGKGPPRDRFRRMRDEGTSRLLWLDFVDLVDWFCLNEVVNEERETIDYFITFALDPAEEAMMPVSYRMGYEILLHRERYTEALRVTPEDLPWLRKQSRLLGAKRPTGDITAGEWASVQAVRERLFADECCRMHVALLAKGRDEEAWEAAELLVRARDTAASRAAIAATALLAGQVREPHLSLLDQAAERGRTEPVLRRAIENVLAAGRP